MEWNEILTEKLLGDKAPGLLKTFLLTEMPAFTAPVDPAAWSLRAAELRKKALAEVYLRGWPAAVTQAFPRIVWGEVLTPDPAYRIRKLRYEVVRGYWIPALLYEPCDLRGKLPVVLNPNGHHPGGKAVIYKQIRCANLARRGVIALSTEFIGMGELSGDILHNNLAMLDLTGQAGVGLFYLALQKALDLLLDHPNADHQRVGVTGLSGGGWQTIVISALDPRVTLSVPVAGYTGVRARLNCLADVGDLEQVPVDLTTVLDYQDMTAMLAPRPALLILNEKDDCCFQTGRAKPVIYDAVLPTYRAFGAEANFLCHSNVDPGTHNYEADNRSQFYKFIAEQWHLDTPATDIHLPSDILPEAALKVGLPVTRETLATMAMKRARRVATRLRTPQTVAAKKRLRKRLTEVIRLPEFARTAAVPAGTLPAPGTSGNVVLAAGPWALPASVRSEAAAADPSVALLVSDAGRATSSVARFPRPGTLWVVDIAATGENKCSALHHMLVDTTGQRQLGHQVAQLLACARFILGASGTPGTRLDLVGECRTGCFVALLTAALEPQLFRSLTLHGNIGSLVHLFEMNERCDINPSMCCFGLLTVADVPQITALLDGIEFRQPTRCAPTQSLPAV